VPAAKFSIRKRKEVGEKKTRKEQGQKRKRATMKMIR